MKKFVIHSTKTKTSIVEVEVVKLSHMESSVPSLREGEWMGKIIRPESLFEKTVDGKLVPPVWCWWAFHDSVEECLSKLKEDTWVALLRAKRKAADDASPAGVSEEEVDKVISSVEILQFKVS